MNIIYIDVLLILNLYVTFFLLKATAAFTHRKVSGVSYAAGSFLGAVSSLVIFLPELPFFMNALIKIAVGLAVVLVTFRFRGIYVFLKQVLIFLLLNMVFAGLMLLIWAFGAPLGMQYKNGYSYFDISFFTILISTVIAYELIKLVRFLLDTRFNAEKVYQMEVTINGQSTTLSGFADTGNKAADFFTGLPVIFCDQNKLSAVLPQDVMSYDGTSELMSSNKYRLLPYNTVGHSGLIPIFQPDKLEISLPDNTKKEVKAMIGITKESFAEQDIDAVFNPKLLI